ncbi:E3 ubiquitin ligase [Quaeritorhiza haematococci]|nr:E3 ubiquitin ligase [Quaeritorhiza haematococci]
MPDIPNPYLSAAARGSKAKCSTASPLLALVNDLHASQAVNSTETPIRRKRRNKKNSNTAADRNHDSESVNQSERPDNQNAAASSSSTSVSAPVEPPQSSSSSSSSSSSVALNELQSFPPQITSMQPQQPDESSYPPSRSKGKGKDIGKPPNPPSSSAADASGTMASRSSPSENGARSTQPAETSSAESTTALDDPELSSSHAEIKAELDRFLSLISVDMKGVEGRSDTGNGKEKQDRNRQVADEVLGRIIEIVGRTVEAEQHELKSENQRLTTEVANVREMLREMCGEAGTKLRSGSTCNICLDYMSNPHVVECGHSYCFDCLFIWLSKTRKCPTCRQDVERKPVLNLSLMDQIESHVQFLPQDDEVRTRYTQSVETFREKENPWALLFDEEGPPAAVLDEADGVRSANCGATFDETDDPRFNHPALDDHGSAYDSMDDDDDDGDIPDELDRDFIDDDDDDDYAPRRPRHFPAAGSDASDDFEELRGMRWEDSDDGGGYENYNSDENSNNGDGEYGFGHAHGGRELNRLGRTRWPVYEYEPSDNEEMGVRSDDYDEEMSDVEGQRRETIVFFNSDEENVDDVEAVWGPRPPQPRSEMGSEGWSPGVSVRRRGARLVVESSDEEEGEGCARDEIGGANRNGGNGYDTTSDVTPDDPEADVQEEGQGEQWDGTGFNGWSGDEAESAPISNGNSIPQENHYDGKGFNGWSGDDEQVDENNNRHGTGNGDDTDDDAYEQPRSRKRRWNEHRRKSPTSDDDDEEQDDEEVHRRPSKRRVVMFSDDDD